MKKLLFALSCAVFALVNGQAGAFDWYQDDQPGAGPYVHVPPVVIRCPTTNGNVLGNCPGLGQGSTLTAAQVSCGTSATSLLPASTTATKRLISNTSGSTIFIGPAGVTTATGYGVPTGTVLDVTSFSGQLFCVAAAATTVSTLTY
jgi:hypothetical protein